MLYRTILYLLRRAILEMLKVRACTIMVLSSSGPEDLNLCYHNPFEDQMTLSQGLPKTIRKHRYLHYNS